MSTPVSTSFKAPRNVYIVNVDLTNSKDNSERKDTKFYLRGKKTVQKVKADDWIENLPV